ncbi:MAG: biotin--[acetyl-CoA-carboxylase] ligase [Lentimicrobiaceae bacterium]|nr:biotin--[acetyl-CoA-carboxylase] ligase [Lentimicrobiaceae bacterium]MCB9023885.1 biotin--[acetyl-CoA-carboxylase] ligase [Lentimicrobiaceae bacterium]MCO5266206.1 biotin--[acetyl-CoA-carboxylase] ligase [Lentimicrobium sp.]HPG32601.1 biotin--[acetyl-CoA-carboxylase] ligase [Lentimicrobium sp.]
MVFKASKIIRLESVDSTNDYLYSILDNNALPEGSVVYAHTQNQGKGQANNIWESEPGKNLTCSLVLYPEFLKPENQFLLTMVVSLSVCSTIEKLQLPYPAMIKWPNDIYLQDKKVAGILIKNEILGRSISKTIIGIGLNINQLKFSELIPNPTSLKLISGIDYSVNDLLTECHNNLKIWYQKLKNGETEFIEQSYMNRFYLLNEPALFEIKGRRIKAEIKGLAEFGMLHLEGPDKEEYICDLKEIVFIPRPKS